jgi:hypothetical protein
MNPNPRPFSEPLLIALLSLQASLTLLAAMFVWWVVQPGQKDAVVVGVFGTILGFIGGALNSLTQALSRDPATARLNAQAAVTNATTLNAATPPAPLPVPPTPPAPVEVTGPGGGPVQTEEAVT